MATDEPEIRIEHREALAYLLTEAAEIEHGLMNCYLYAAWSLGKRTQERPHAEAIERWRKVIIEVALDEMQHLALVANLANAIGAMPHFQRPNFPVAPGYHPAGVVVSLAPFSVSTIDHFVFLERPEGSALPDGVGFAAPAPYERQSREGRLVPGAHDYRTVGHLYRGIEAGLEHLAERLGEANLFDGDPRLQLDGKALGMPLVTPIVDLASAKAALEAIVTQGEGAGDDTHNSHYQKFCAIRDELRAILDVDPTFDPAGKVATSPVMRRPPIAGTLTWVDAEPAASVLDVANALYAFSLRSLGTLTSPVSLAPGARGLAMRASMLSMRALSPIGELLAELPASTTRPGIRAGMTFTMSRSTTSMPEPKGAFRALFETARAVADRVRTQVLPHAPELAGTASMLDQLATDLGQLADTATMPHYGDQPTAAAAAPLKQPLAYTPGAIEEARGEAITIRFEAKRCIHARHCVLGAPKVFLANTPGTWLFPDEADPNYLAHIAQSCPSGAITYTRHDGQLEEEPPPINSLRIRENGPYTLSADTTLIGHGRLLRATLCRCGASKNKPFCDGTHNAIEFQATGEPATRLSEPLTVRGGNLEVRPLPDGPLEVSGPLEVCANTGRTVDRITGARLCRCGASSTKPFCDGTHAKIGFKST